MKGYMSDGKMYKIVQECTDYLTGEAMLVVQSFYDDKDKPLVVALDMFNSMFRQVEEEKINKPLVGDMTDKQRNAIDVVERNLDGFAYFTKFEGSTKKEASEWLNKWLPVSKDYSTAMKNANERKARAQGKSYSKSSNRYSQSKVD
jgi:hypothetical protein